MNKKLLSAFLVAIISLSIFGISSAAAQAPAPASQVWSNTYGGKTGDAGFKVIQTTDGGFIAVGTTASFADSPNLLDVLVVKTAADGTTQWIQPYHPNSVAHTWNVGMDIKQTSDGGYIIGALTSPQLIPINPATLFGLCPVAITTTDAYLIKIGSDGAVQWQQTYNLGKFDAPMAVAQMEDGYVAVGVTSSITNSLDGFAMKVNGAGTLMETRVYGTPRTQDGLYDVAVTGDNQAVVTGYTQTAPGKPLSVMVAKLDAQLNVMWMNTYGVTGNNNVGRSIAVDAYPTPTTSDNCYIVGGTSFTANPPVTSNGNNMLLIKIAPNGDEIWGRTFGGPGDSRGFSAQQTRDGGYVIAGTIQAPESHRYDGYVVKTDMNGEESWQYISGGTMFDQLYSIRQLGDGSYIAAGVRNNPVPAVSNSPCKVPLNLWLTKLTEGTPVAPFDCVSSVPASGATNIAITAPISVTFNRPVQVPNNGGVPTGIILSWVAGGAAQEQAITFAQVTGDTIQITPVNVLTPGTQYTLTILQNGVLDLNNNQLPAPCIVQFVTQQCAAPSAVQYTGAMRVPGYMSYLMWSFQNDGGCDAWVAPWAKVYGDCATPNKIGPNKIVNANWYFPTGEGQQAVTTTMGLGWGLVHPQSTTTFVTPGIMKPTDKYVVSWYKVWDAFSGTFQPQIGAKITKL
jgi:hypothetical protein